MWSYISKSTLKREFASSLTYWLLAVATYLIFTAPTWDQAYRVVSDFLLPILTLAAAAFGAEYVAKQTNFGGTSHPESGPSGNGDPPSGNP